MLEGGCEGSCEDECEGGCGEDCGLGYEDGCELGCKLGMPDGYKFVKGEEAATHADAESRAKYTSGHNTDKSSDK